MTIEDKPEFNNGEKPKVIEVHRFTTDALRTLPIPQGKQGGCRFMPQRSVITAEDPSYYWEMDEVNQMVQSLQGPDMSPSIEADLANLFGNIIMSLRKGERIVIEEEPKVRIARVEDIRQRPTYCEGSFD